MDDIKEAIKEMRHTKQFYSGHRSFDLAINALERQIPKKVSSKSMHHNCPNCTSRLEIEFTDYCPDCGQKLDWSVS